MQQRYYDPQIGRFLSVDPIPVLTDSAFNFNRFNYANNNPFRFTDPDGRMSKEDATERRRAAEDRRRKEEEEKKRKRDEQEKRNNETLKQQGFVEVRAPDGTTMMVHQSMVDKLNWSDVTGNPPNYYELDKSPEYKQCIAGSVTTGLAVGAAGKTAFNSYKHPKSGVLTTGRVVSRVVSPTPLRVVGPSGPIGGALLLGNFMMNTLPQCAAQAAVPEAAQAADN